MIPIARPLIGEEEIAAVVEVLRSGQLAQGPKVAEFEAAFAQFCGAKHAIANVLRDDSPPSRIAVARNW